MKEIQGTISAIINEYPSENTDIAFLSSEDTAVIRRYHRSVPAYAPTPLCELKELACKLNLGSVFVKDESKRFGLNAFKGLGGSYAIARIICEKLGLDIHTISFEDLLKPEVIKLVKDMVFITATDGNHGKGVAWAAGLFGCKAYINMPKGSVERRVDAIRKVNSNAQVKVMDTAYDDTVRYSSRIADENGWYLVQDTSWEGYEQVPEWIMQGYTTMAGEACDQLASCGKSPTHVLVQAGVGAMAGSVAGYLVNRYGERCPKIIVVEPENMACIYRSAKENDGKAHPAADQKSTIMAGLDCGEPCTIAWPILRDYGYCYIKCPDYVTEHGMRILAHPEGGDAKIVSGESGAVTTGLVDLICSDPEYAEIKNALKLDESSVVLCFSTEGDTDPENYKRIVGSAELPG